MTITAKGIDEAVMAPGLPPEGRAYPGFNPRRENADGLVIDRDIAVTLRDGVTIYADVLRPEGIDGPLPAILLWSAYGKHARWPRMPQTGIDPDALSPHTVFECPDPVPWCARGYAIVVADPRGVCSSEGDVSVFSPQEGEDVHDTIEWIAAQPWCDGKVGMAGASYFGISQWLAGATRPPHIAALLPYDGVSDPYRELAFHGGIPNSQFVSAWNPGTRFSRNRAEDWVKAMALHPLFDDYWQSKRPAVERIDVPTYVVSGWTDHGIHTRGTLGAWRRLGTEQKWLEVHGRNKWVRMYEEDSVARQIAFFDRFLRGIINEVDDWPKVRIEVRERLNVGAERIEREWPLARTDYVPLYLDARDGTLGPDLPLVESTLRYDATAPEAEALFGMTLDQDTELTGYFKLKLWVSAEDSSDMDLFVAVRKINADGEIVHFPYFTTQVNGEVAHGWLRVSHRALDPDASTPWQPVHPHDREQPLVPGEIVPVEIEIWPSSTRFQAGERIELIVKGSDIHVYPVGAPAPGHPMTRNVGHHIIHSGGRYDSHLLVPLVPAAE